MDIQDMREMIAAATPGEWSAAGMEVTGGGQFIANCHVIRRVPFQAGVDEGKANATLIVAAVNSLPQLLNEHEAMRKALDDLEISSGRVLSLYDASDLQWGDARGFADSIDNSGKPYESSALATAIYHLRQELVALAQSGKGE